MVKGIWLVGAFIPLKMTWDKHFKTTRFAMRF
jgi:hypothetical protein